MNDSIDQDIKPWLLFSLLLHGILLLFSNQFYHRMREENFKPIEIELREPWQERSSKQIVDIADEAPQEQPKETRYLSKHNQRVEKETQARLTQPVDRQKLPLQGALNEKGKARKEVSSKLGDFALKKENPPGLFGNPTETNFLPGVEIGDKTYINAEAFKHTSYYLEIKRKIEITWNPSIVLRHMMLSGTNPGRRIFTTVLGITLDGEGSLADLILVETSGIPALDAEAKRAFKASAPFTRAPEELLSPDGKLRFEFGFIILDH